MKKKVFLGGTCNGSTWRDKVIPKLKIEYFNPVTDNWTPERQEEEIKQRRECDFVLYHITPKMTGTYSIEEVVDDSNKRPEKTLLCFQSTDEESEFSDVQIKSLKAVARMIEENGGRYFENLETAIEYLNKTT